MRLDTIHTLMPNSYPSKFSYPSKLFLLGAGILIGRNYIKGIAAKIGGIVADKLGRDAIAWNQSSENSFELAKTHTFRDLKLVAGLAALYAVVGMTHVSSMTEAKDREETVENIDKKIISPSNIEGVCNLNENMEASASCDHLTAQLADCTKYFQDYRSLKTDYFFLQLYATFVAVASLFTTCYQLRK